MKKLACLCLMLGFAALSYGEELKLKIEGMSCPQGCVKNVETALNKVSGVTDKKVELGKATVTFDASKTSKAKIVAAVEKAGYKVAN